MIQMTVPIEGVDKINTSLPSKPQPFDFASPKANAPSFDDMLRRAMERPQEINDRLNQDKIRSTQASSDDVAKTASYRESGGDTSGGQGKAVTSSVEKSSKENITPTDKNAANDERGTKDVATSKEPLARGIVKGGTAAKTPRSALVRGVITQGRGKAVKSTEAEADAHVKDGKHSAVPAKRGVMSHGGKAAVAKAGKTKGEDTDSRLAIAKKETDANKSGLNAAGKAQVDDAVALSHSGIAANAARAEAKDGDWGVAQKIPLDEAVLSADKVGGAPAADTAVASTKGKGAAAKTAKKKTLDADGKIEVADLRTANDKARVREEASERGDKMVAKLDAQKTDTQVQVSLTDTAQQNITSSSTQSASASTSTFQAMVENQIRENTPEIVRAGQLILRDNNVGTINLVMHPENLGNVRIVLHLADNVISGQITVHSEEAYNAFKNSATALSQAFNDSGFNSQGFSVAYSGANASGQGGEQQGQFNQPSFMSARASAGYDNAAVSVSDAGFASYSGDYSVNIVA